MRKELTSILKSENLKPKEMALILLSDIHESEVNGKSVLDAREQESLIKRVKSFDDKPDCDLYNTYVYSYFATKLIYIDVKAMKEQLSKCFEVSSWIVKNLFVLNLVNTSASKELEKSIKDSKEYGIKRLKYYVSNYRSIFSRLLAFQEILKKISGYVNLEVDKEVNKIVSKVYEDANTLDEVYDTCKLDPELRINISSIEMNEKELEGIYNLDLHDNFRLKFLKTA